MSKIKLFTKAAILTQTSYSNISFKLANGYQIGLSEDEVRGKYYQYLRENFSEYDIKEMIFMEVPLDEINKLINPEVKDD